MGLSFLVYDDPNEHYAFIARIDNKSNGQRNGNK